MSTPDGVSADPAATAPIPVIGLRYLIANFANFANLLIPPVGPIPRPLGLCKTGIFFPKILPYLVWTRGRLLSPHTFNFFKSLVGL